LLVHGAGGLIIFCFANFYFFFLVCYENIFYVSKTSAGENKESFLAAFRVFLFAFFGGSTLRRILAMKKGINPLLIPPSKFQIPKPDKPEKCLKCLRCAKMPKIMVSLQASPSATTRQVAPSLLETSDIISMKNNKSASGYNYIPCFLLLIKSIEFLNFRHFRHFVILGIYWGNWIVSQKDLAT
jgi:hypothetical protein